MQLTLKLPPDLEEGFQTLLLEFPLAVRHRLIIAILRVGMEQALKDPTKLKPPQKVPPCKVRTPPSISGVWE